MGWTCCAVVICKNTSKDSHVSLHTFPSNEKLRKIWVLKCRRADQFNVDYAKVCSAHFPPQDFERDLQAELLGSRQRRILKPNAIPSLNLKAAVVFSKSAEARNKRRAEKQAQLDHRRQIEMALSGQPYFMSSAPSTAAESDLKTATVEKEINCKEIVGSRLEAILSSTATPSLNAKQTAISKSAADKSKRRAIKQAQMVHKRQMESSVSSNTASTARDDFTTDLVEVILTESDVEEEKNYKELYEKLLEEKAENHFQAMLLEEENDSLTAQLQEAEKCKEEALVLALRSQDGEELAHNALRKVFSNNEIRLLMEKRQMVHWTDEEIAKAATLKSISKRAYLYLRDNRGYPYPGNSTLKMWATKGKLRKETPPDVLERMTLACTNFSEC